MKVSLILATLGRDRELDECLSALAEQTYQDFEVIIVDQNKDGKIDAIVTRYETRLDIMHHKVDFTGIARARDYGIGQVRGTLVAFPDDDCAYDKEVIAQAVGAFSNKPGLGVLVAGSYQFASNRFSIGVNSSKARYFSRLGMMGVEFTLFFDLTRIDRSQFYFDHDFGIGSKYSGAEGFELLYRLLRSGSTAYYDPEIKIYHPDKDHYRLGTGRMLMYSTGIGAYIRKFANERDVFILYYIARKMFAAPLLKMLWALLLLNPKRLAYSFYNLIGIWRGFFAYGREPGNA